MILNLADDLRQRGGSVDAAALSRQLGVPVALVSARSGEGISQVLDFLAGAMPQARAPGIAGTPGRARMPQMGRSDGRPRPVTSRPRHPNGRAAWIRFFCIPCSGRWFFGCRRGGLSDHLFGSGAPVQDTVDWFDASGNWIAHVSARHRYSVRCSSMASGRAWARCMVFLPQILLLFLFIGILEDSGYLSRAALIADRTMARIGLQGKSFIPLLSAYGCAVPAIMSTRTIENRRDRMATILIAPFMTCSARMPIYLLMIAAFIPKRNLLGGLLGMQTAVMLGLYILGFRQRS